MTVLSMGTEKGKFVEETRLNLEAKQNIKKF